MTIRKLPDVTARRKLIEAITTPLGFFVLGLSIIDTFLGTALVFAGLTGQQKMICMYLGVALFILVISIVASLVWFRPQNLTFDKEAHLASRDQTE